MDHKAFLSSLSADQRQNLLRQSDVQGLLHLAGHWGLIFLIAVPVAVKAPLWPLFMLPLGILLISNFMLLHETVHLTPFRSNWLNRVVGRVASLAIGLPYDWFRYFHMAHHKYTNDPENDPELVVPKPRTRWQYLRHISGLPVWLSHIRQLFRNALVKNTDRFIPKRSKARMKTEARAMLLFYAAVVALAFTIAPWLWRCWLLPVLIGQPFLRLYLLAEHGRCPPVANMFENSRTTFTTAIVRFLAWNMPYHCEHHAYPTVPFHALPDLHNLASKHLLTTSDGYSEFHKEYVADLNRQAGDET
ncbi:MAG: fatty acid desaturase [Rhodobacteraceae bacterium]|nr:fatty acid desaturase [Paracoccaceae bacterium]